MLLRQVIDAEMEGSGVALLTIPFLQFG